MDAEVLTMQAGKLRDRVVIQAPTRGIDTLGAPTRAPWTDVWTCRARIETLKAREFFSGNREESAVDSKITIRYPPRAIQVNADCRVIDTLRQIYYAVTGVVYDDKRSMMTLMCVSGVADG